MEYVPTDGSPTRPSGFSVTKSSRPTNIYTGGALAASQAYTPGPTTTTTSKRLWPSGGKERRPSGPLNTRKERPEEEEEEEDDGDA